MLHNLGYTRTSRQPDHTLLTPDSFVRAPLPGMRNANAIVHVSPAIGARFTQYTAEFSADGKIPPCSEQRFVFVLEGELTVGKQKLTAEGYAYLPQGSQTAISSTGNARAVVIEKSYVPLSAPPPEEICSSERDVKSQSLGDGLEVRILLPENPSFDFAVNTMTYQPGAALPMVESHVMEHGLLMLAGGGIYRLSDHWYPVTAGDFIWMAPWCLQWFGALGPTPAKYLIYKDWNR
ncbi:MAG TPA: (S)-ureidoglycine aminohydrolase [Terriglobales bacterium]|nr:(S)-ureidoglycine aminohydrolase [Terriglobales bacterium]